MSARSSAAGHSHSATPTTPNRSGAVDERDPAAEVADVGKRIAAAYRRIAALRAELAAAGDPPPYLTGGIVRRDQARRVGER